MPHVLIVEDQPAVAKALSVLLEIHDISSCTASSPEAALDTPEILGNVIELTERIGSSPVS